MFSRTKSRTDMPMASWRRELLQPLLTRLAPIAYMATTLDLPGELSFLLVPFLMIGTACLPLMIPRHMVAGSKLNRPVPSRQEDAATTSTSRLERVSNGVFGSRISEDYEGRILLPEIDTAPPWVQNMISTLGARGPFPKPPHRIRIFVEALLIIASIAIYVTFLWWLDKNNLARDQNLWAFLTFTALTLITAYRSAFRRLHDIYTADAQTTGRHAFPALRQ